ncbi:MAG: DEAD/DEAH box helicase [Proteobacteria bacterium]|nr:DEAD/DEAH box helicase [Pseudomonadota bacterium]
MQQMGASNNGLILNYVSNSLDHEIWQQGIQVYRSAKITLSTNDHGLIAAEVADHKAPGGTWNIRLMLHFNGQVIRWFECGCLYNRKSGGLCEHLVAVLIYISREKPSLFAALDPKSPFSVNNIRGNQKKLGKAFRDRRAALGANVPLTHNEDKTSFLNHISNPIIDLVSHGSISSLDFIEKTGQVSLKFEVKRSFKDHIELSVDESAHLLMDASFSKWRNKYLSYIEVLPFQAYPGWKVVSGTDNEVWQARKVMIFKLSADNISMDEEKIQEKSQEKSREKTQEKTKVKSANIDNALLEKLRNSEICVEETTMECLHKGLPHPILRSRLQTLPSKQEKSLADGVLFSIDWRHCMSSSGKDFVFLAGLGYISLDRSAALPSWNRASQKSYFRGKEIDRLFDTNFKALSNQAPTLVAKEWLSGAIVDGMICRIDICDYDGHRFSMDPKYRNGEELHSLSALLMHAKDKNRQYIAQDNRWVKVPRMMIDLDLHIDEERGVLLLDTLILLRWQSLCPQIDGLWHGDESLLNALRHRMSFHDTVGEELSFEHTNLTLRDYQVQGTKWLWWLYKNHLHGLFADDMGLGKTHQTMALLSLIHRDEPTQSEDSVRFLVICPTTVVGHWMEKMEDFTPLLRPLKYHGFQRQLQDGYITLVTSYGVLLRDIEYLSKRHWDVVVCDEAHMIKNPKTSTYWACKRLKARMRLCLSGTPIENRLWELKTLYDFLVPGYLGSSDFFKAYYAISPTASSAVLSDTEVLANEQKEARLKRLIKPLKLRRTKDQVLQDLPEKVEDIRRCELSASQKHLYQTTLDGQAQVIHDLQDDKKPISYMHVFALLQRLKQICNHPSLINGVPWQKETSEKFELLKELLRESLGSGHKVVVFSQYVKMIDIINAYLNEQGISYVSLVGKSRNRDKIVRSFQTDPSIQVFVGSLLAGGVGIDLTAASVVIHYDRWWNASKENQATDRVHRIGQKHSLLVLKLVTHGTIEEKIDAMIEEKQKLFDTFLTKDGATFRQFTRKELIELVSSNH